MHKLNKLAAAVTLATVAAGAQASLVTGAANTDGELFLLALDTAGRTLVVDLGVNYATLNANSASTDWFAARDIGSLVGNAFTFGNGVKWSLAAARTKTAGGASTALNNGLFATVNVDLSTIGANGTDLQLGTSFTAANARLNNIRNATVNKAANLNTEPGASNAFPTSVTADNDFYVFEEPTGPRSFASGWGDSFNNAYTAVKTTATVGTDTSLAFFHWYLSGPPNSIQSEQLPGVWSFSQSGVLSYGAPAPIPLPASVWLLGAGIAGLAARRRRAIAG